MTRLSENRTRKTSSLRRRRAGTGSLTNKRSPAGRAAGAVAEPREDGTAKNREKDGGQFPVMSGTADRPDILAGPAAESAKAPESDPLLAMRAKFLSDFTDWLIGRHPDTYQPRARIMRQWTEASRLHGAPAPPRPR